MRSWHYLIVFVAAGVLGWWSNPPGVSARKPAALARQHDAVDGGIPASARALPLPRAGSPATAAAPASSAVQLTPGAPGYDGELAALWLGIGPPELFRREPIDRAWAPAMEAELAAVIGAQLRSASLDGDVANVTCHTSTCVIDMEVEGDAEARMDEYLNFFVPLGSTITRRTEDLEGGRVLVTYTTIYENKVRAPADWKTLVARWQGERAELMARWKPERGMP